MTFRILKTIDNGAYALIKLRGRNSRQNNKVTIKMAPWKIGKCLSKFDFRQSPTYYTMKSGIYYKEIIKCSWIWIPGHRKRAGEYELNKFNFQIWTKTLSRVPTEGAHVENKYA